MMSRFIALEGADGCGKSTQVDRLAAWLTEDGQQVVTVRELPRPRSNWDSSMSS